MIGGLVLSAAAVGQAPTSSAVAEVVPDVGATIGEALLPHVASWRVVAESADGNRQENGVWTDRFELIELGEYRLIRFEQTFIDAVGAELRHNVFLSRYPSLVPVHAELNLPTGRLLTEYFGREVDGSFHRKGAAEAEPFREVLERQAFDFWVAGFLMLGPRLRTGTAIRAPFFAGTIDGNSGIRWMEMRVGERETLQFEGKDVETHVVYLSELGWRMWMVPEPPYVYRSAIPASNGGTTWFELLRHSS